MTTITHRLARIAIAKPWITIGVWLLLAVGITVAAGAAGRNFTDEVAIPGSDSQQASELLGAIDEGGGTRLIIGADAPVTDPATAAAIDELLAEVGDALAVDIVNPLLDPQRAAASGALSADSKAVSAAIDVAPDDLTGDQEAAAMAALDHAKERGLDAAFAGELARSLDAAPSRVSEVIGLVAAIVVLTLALGSALAMTVPVGVGLVSVACGLGTLGLTTHAASVPETAATLATMIGLGVGIDYALFQVTRLRTALAEGAAPREAVLTMAASAGSAAAFAGLTVALAITALAISGVAFIGWLGYGSAIVVLTVVCAALTLTPAVLILIAGRLRPRETTRAPRRSFSDVVVAHPWTTGLAAIAILAVLAIPAASLSLGMSGPGDRPDSTQARQSFDLREEHWGAGANAGLTVVVALDSPADGPTDPRLASLSTAIGAAGGASATPLVPMKDDASTATASVTPNEGANAGSTAELLQSLRAIEEPEGASLHVGGPTATRIDLAERVEERLPWLMGAVVAASTLLLLFAFRSVLIPLKAAVMNLLSVGASYGVVVAVFQWGWGDTLVGLDGPVAIDSFVPMILFTVLFGLSTDYEVFLVSAMRETWDCTGDARGAIVDGMRASGRVITTAAVIMIAVFLSFVSQPDPTIKIFGLGLAASIFLDATVIRMLLVPAVMRALGKRAWWLPAWLDRRLPRVDMHG